MFDVPIDVARQRLDAERVLDKFEQEQSDFFTATRDVYLQRAAQFPNRIRVIDSTQPLETVRHEVEKIIQQLIQQR